MQYNQYHISLLLKNAVTTGNNIKKVIMLLEKYAVNAFYNFGAHGKATKHYFLYLTLVKLYII